MCPKGSKLRDEPVESDLRLTPLLLTTLVPVAIYSSAVAVLGLIIGPMARVAAYLSGLLGEKKHTPFRELAVLLSLLLTTAKAVSAWIQELSHLPPG